MTHTPNRLLEELGQAAARYNKRVTEHSHNCCHVCRRLLNDISAALLDPSNWIPEPVGKQLDVLREQLNGLSEQMNLAALSRPVQPPAEPIQGVEPEPGFFGPPPPREDD